MNESAGQDRAELTEIGRAMDELVDVVQRIAKALGRLEVEVEDLGLDIEGEAA